MRQINNLKPVWILFVLFAHSVSAKDSGVFNIQLENDVVAGNDRHFTHGTRFSYLSEEYSPKGLFAWIAETAMPTGAIHRWTWAAGQNMYTPENIASHEPILNDRPYAGWSYGSLGLLADSRGKPAENEIGKAVFWELQVGTLGPRSRADDTQRWIHRTLGAQRPNGWEWQVRDKWGAIAYLDYQYEISPTNKPLRNLGIDWLNGIEADVVPHFGFAGGNVYSHVAGGVTYRIGWDLRSDYGPPRIRPGISGPGAFKEGRNAPGMNGYLFVGTEARAVGNNDFLLGNVSGPEHRISMERLVYDTQYGLIFDPFSYLRIAFTRVIRSREFKEQSEGDKFGAVAVQFRTGF